jgi:hypothetical protein
MSDWESSDRRMRSWLEDGPHTAPPDLLPAVLEEVGGVREAIGVRRLGGTGAVSTIRLALAVSAVLILAVVVVGGPRLPSISVGEHSSPSPDRSASATSPSPTASTAEEEPLEPGSHMLPVDIYSYDSNGQAVRSNTFRVTFDLQAGWKGFGGFAVSKNRAAPPNGVGLSVWAVDRIYVDPCHTSSSDVVGWPAVDSADGLADAVWATWGPEARAPTAPTATRPAGRTLAGLPARYTEITAPSALSFDSAEVVLGVDECDAGHYYVWRDVTPGIRWLQGPSERDGLWILDMDGSSPGGVLVIDATWFPGTSSADRAELQAALDSIRIRPALP